MKTEIRRNPLLNYNLSSQRAVSMPSIGYYFIKRCLDILISVTALVVLSPLLALIALLIFLYSPGPVFFVQERVGARRVSRNGQTSWEKELFRCYKFRSMKLNADPAIHKAYVSALIKNDENQMSTLQGQTTEVRKLLHDPRVTRPGKLLRKWSLDELPQIWNVLRGEMSWVGPRPAIPYEVDVYQPWHLRRLEAKPGITGLQQVEARCTADFDEQVWLDIRYIENQSIEQDIKILWKTIWVVFSTKGAH